jgi:hypothetical protein
MEVLVLIEGIEREGFYDDFLDRAERFAKCGLGGGPVDVQDGAAVLHLIHMEDRLAALVRDRRLDHGEARVAPKALADVPRGVGASLRHHRAGDGKQHGRAGGIVATGRTDIDNHSVIPFGIVLIAVLPAFEYIRDIFFAIRSCSLIDPTMTGDCLMV